MALKFRLVKRKVLAGAEKDTVKNYATAKCSGYCDLSKLCDLIAARSSMSSADVKSILDSLNWAMDIELKAGNIVQLGELGNFRMSLSSAGTIKEEDFDATQIRKAKIIFSPGASLRQTRKTTTFAPDDVRVVEKECDKEHVL